MKEVMTNLIVVKRSGQRVNFNGPKIAIAIKYAFDSIYDNYDEKQVNIVYESVLKYIIDNYSDRKTINVEDIQDIIENKLKENGFTQVYEAFNLYRIRRAASREVFSVKQQHKFVKAIEKLVFDQKKQETLPLKTKFDNIVSTEFSKAYLLENKCLRGHEEGILYINDLDLYPSGVITKTHLDLTNLVVNENYINNLIQLILSIYSENKSECSIGSIDILLVPWVINTFKEIFKVTLFEYLDLDGLSDYISFEQLQRVIKELNTINISMNVFERYALNDHVLTLFRKAYNNSINKLEKNIKLNIYRLITSLNKTVTDGNFSISLSGNKNYECIFIKKIVLQILDENETFKNMSTFIRLNNNDDFIDVVVSLIKNQKNIILMNKNIKDLEYFKNGEKVFENILSDEFKSNGRFVISSTTINLARVAYRNVSFNSFLSDLSNAIELCKNQLLQRFEYQASKSKEEFKYIFSNNVLIDNEKLESGQKVRKVIKNGVFSINLSGLIESIKMLENDEKKYYKLGLDIISFINKKVKKISEENKLNFILTSECSDKINSKFMSLDKSIYGIKKDINDKNSYDLLNNFFENINIEDENELLWVSKYQKMIGFIPNISIKGKINEKKILKIIEYISKSNIDVYKIVGDQT